MLTIISRLNSVLHCRATWCCSATTCLRPWQSCASLPTSKSTSKWSKEGTKLFVREKDVTLLRGWLCCCLLQRSLRHPAGQRGLRGLQERPGVCRLPGQEWPPHGGESGGGPHNARRGASAHVSWPDTLPPPAGIDQNQVQMTQQRCSFHHLYVHCQSSCHRTLASLSFRCSAWMQTFLKKLAPWKYSSKPKNIQVSGNYPSQ